MINYYKRITEVLIASIKMPISNFSSYGDFLRFPHGQSVGELTMLFIESGLPSVYTRKVSPNTRIYAQMGNPLDIGCPLCLVYTFLRLAISTSIRHFLLLSKNFVSKDRTKILRILICTYTTFSFSFSLCNSNNILISQFLFSIAEK